MKKLPDFIENLDTSKPRINKLFWLLALTSIFDCLLLGYRLNYISFDYSLFASISDIAYFRGIPTFFFLVWNLFLAWVPYLVALSLKHLKKSKIVIAAMLILWLLFFPNAPYIITDLLHLRHRPPVPMWYDVMLFFSFAWTGLILGFASLMEVEKFLQKRLSKWQVQSFVFGALSLCGFGVFVGRFQRWNSWDVLANPFHLFFDMMEVLLHPTAYWGTFGLTIVLSGMLILGYYTLRHLGEIRR
jgi:uncharacterized membrane protein